MVCVVEMFSKNLTKLFIAQMTTKTPVLQRQTASDSVTSLSRIRHCYTTDQGPPVHSKKSGGKGGSGGKKPAKGKKGGADGQSSTGNPSGVGSSNKPSK